MKECRHPNICLFIGLSRAPTPDGRIFIISEFIDNGNVRLYIHDKIKQFPWRMRMSFATDVTRALAYLHARKCIHRDLKGENLLITSNGRLKITDFGFARIAARNEEESKRLTFCGTDSYMSPEILLGNEFGLPTDIFSLGIIFCEIAARKLADDNHFKRHPPEFGIDTDELRKLVSPGCPPDFLSLCLDCLAVKPSARPTTRDVLERLRLIEAEVLVRPEEGEDLHVGSIKFMTGGKRPAAGPRIPSFGMGIGKEIRNSAASDDSEDELMEAVLGLSSLGVNSDWSEATNGEYTTSLIDECLTMSLAGHPHLLHKHDAPSTFSEYSTTVIRSHPQQPTLTQIPTLSSTLTIRPSADPNLTFDPILSASATSISTTPPAAPVRSVPDTPESTFDPFGTSSIVSIASLDSYHTANSSIISSTRATGGGSTICSLVGTYTAPLVHRFTLLKPGVKPKRNSGSMTPSRSTGEVAAGWNPLDLFFSSALLVAKCDVCNKRLGWKPVLECDDCGLRSVFLSCMFEV